MDYNSIELHRKVYLVKKKTRQHDKKNSATKTKTIAGAGSQ